MIGNPWLWQAKHALLSRCPAAPLVSGGNALAIDALKSAEGTIFSAPAKRQAMVSVMRAVSHCSRYDTTRLL
jgi:hypothetical protein